MNPFDDDELRRRLSSLGSDLDQAGLPGAGAARQRAAQRTRHQVTTGVAAGVAVVGLGGLGLFQVLGPAQDRVDPAPPPSTSPTTTEPTTPPAVAHIPDDAFITIDDLDDNSPTLSWEPADGTEVPQDCLDLTGWDAEASGARHFIQQPGEAHVEHQVFVAPDDQHALFDNVVQQVSDCVPNRWVQDLPLPFWVEKYRGVGVGDDMWSTVYVDDGYTEDVQTITHISVMRHDTIVSVLVRTLYAPEWPERFGLDTAVDAARRACTAIHGETCVEDDYEFVDAEPDSGPEPGNSSQPDNDAGDETGGDGTGTDEPGGTATGGGSASPGDPSDDPLTIGDDPFLPDDDVNPIGDTGDVFERVATDGEAQDNVTTTQSSSCVDPLPAADATRFGLWSNGLDASFGETVLQFGSADEAAAFVAAHQSRPEPCADSGDPTIEVTNTPPVAVAAGDSAYAWQVDYTPTPENPGAGTGYFGAAMAQRENVVVVLTFGAMGDPTDGTWTAFAEDRLASALDAAIDRG